MATCKKNCFWRIHILLLPIVLQAEGHTHHISFAGLHCKMCPHGTHWVSDCDSDGQQDKCEPCLEGYYQSWYNISPWCVPCNTECPGHHHDSNIVQAAACTNTSNLKCACREGYRMHHERHHRHHRHDRNPSCIHVTSCHEGEGVERPADGNGDTKCVPCIPGSTFSNVSSTTETCRECTLCEETEVVVTQCTSVKDTVCRLMQQQYDKAEREVDLSIETELNTSARVTWSTSNMAIVILALLQLKSF